ncbi:predicted UDP-glucose 6-dehydrogenase [Corynebacterium renale]|uniref:UDP-glucose dehydrogenase family protein n=1 Tax=Corynebacterium renale TaxID=1724 RepID=UPI000DA2BA87|nr:UDP-glucose/GDP-mannose dehydrogenase family protein [Corynebacterium renale]SQG63418.1 predicted UDP-glucose 6-dehydrogenase [Corynebacterium renale]STD00014.1 predicted UDP-glucose 6-dehydrogenase [Corynebacterium renale]
MRISVIGAGYLGVTHAACMAELGHEVVACDVDAGKIATLASAHVPFFEPGLEELVARHTATGQVRWTTDTREAASGAQLHFICVGTPQQAGSPAADVSAVFAAVDGLASHIRAAGESGHVIVGKSTVPVGTAAALQERVGDVAEVVWNPEFLREGHAVGDTLNPDRIVTGTRDGAPSSALREVYAPLADVPWIETDIPTAELIKVSANTFLAAKISLLNLVGEVCEAAGADVHTVSRALGFDARIGNKHMRAGLGFGGGCLPKDIRAFAHRGEELGVDMSLVHAVDAVNQRRRARVVGWAGEMLGGVQRRRITVLGAAFKPNSDDVRDSPSLAVARALVTAGARVTVYDPKATVSDLPQAESVRAALLDAELVIIGTDWPQFADLKPKKVGKWVSRRLLIDARAVLPTATWQEAGWEVRTIGRGY